MSLMSLSGLRIYEFIWIYLLLRNTDNSTHHCPANSTQILPTQVPTQIPNRLHLFYHYAWHHFNSNTHCGPQHNTIQAPSCWYMDIWNCIHPINKILTSQPTHTLNKMPVSCISFTNMVSSLLSKKWDKINQAWS